MFDFPAGILPMTNVKEEDEKKLNSSYPTNDLVRLIAGIQKKYTRIVIFLFESLSDQSHFIIPSIFKGL